MRLEGTVGRRQEAGHAKVGAFSFSVPGNEPILLPQPRTKEHPMADALSHDDALIDIHAVCRRLGRSRASLYRDIAKGALPHVNCSRVF